MKDRTVTTLCAVLAISAIANVGLAIRNWDLRQEALESKSPRPVPGSQINTITLSDLSGNDLVLSFPRKRPIILYSVRPDCAWCKKNFKLASELAEATQGDYDLLVLVRESDVKFDQSELKNYLELARSAFSARGPFTIVNPEFEAILGGTPQTIVVAGSGKVKKNWAGAYAGDLHKAVSAYFDIDLAHL